MCILYTMRSHHSTTAPLQTSTVIVIVRVGTKSTRLALEPPTHIQRQRQLSTLLSTFHYHQYFKAMPPRKRARGGSTTTPRGRGRGRGRSTSVASTRTTRSTTTPGPAPSDDPTTPLLTQRRTRTTTAQASPYRTRHRRAVRGPEIAALEGGEEDLVPPSDDDEYDAWRLSRRVSCSSGWC